MSGMNERRRIDNSRKVLHSYDFLCPSVTRKDLGLTLPLPDSDWLTISRPSFKFTSYRPALNSFKRERAISFTDFTANGRIL
jgi:hypothetical protein